MFISSCWDLANYMGKKSVFLTNDFGKDFLSGNIQCFSNIYQKKGNIY